MKKQFVRSLVVSLAGVMLLGVSCAPAFAATSSSTTNNTNTLKISPVRTDLTINPGQSGTVSMKVYNLTSSPIEVQPIENDFTASPKEDGTPSLILDQNSYAPTHSLKRFMAPLSDVTVPAGTYQTVTLTINVPANAQAGGYYGAVRFAPVSSDGSGNVNLNASAASLVLLTVPGALVDQLNLTNFDIEQKNGGAATSFHNPNNLSLLIRFENQGNVQEAPFGQITVQKGKKVLYTYNFNQAYPRDEILSDSARRWTVPLKNLGKFGKYTISGTFTYGSTNKSINVVKTVWIIPTWVIFGGIILIVVIVILILILISMIRGRSRRASRRAASRRY